METRPVIVSLLEELAQAWTDLFTFEDLRADVNKLKLLQEARDELRKSGINPTDTIRGFYNGVFLREQFGTGSPGET